MELRSHTVNFSALIQGCARRPAVEADWAEFVRLYHPTILGAVSFVLRARSDRQEAADEMRNDLVQAVYRKLIEQRSQLLVRMAGKTTESAHNYLAMISINVVRDYLANAEILKPQQVPPTRFESAAEKA
jgi:hypothetical protein